MKVLDAKLVVRNRTMNRIMEEALREGGIELWAEKITDGDEKNRHPARMFLCDSISEGYTIKIRTWGGIEILSKAKMLEGTKRAFEIHPEWFEKNRFGFYEYSEKVFNNVDCNDIVQYALFGNEYY